MLKRAAEIEGPTLTDFVVSAAREAACRMIEATEIIRLSAQDQRQIAEALLIFQGRGLGAALLADAASRTLKADVGAFTLLVDAKNNQAVAFYQRFGFRILASQPGTLSLLLWRPSKNHDDILHPKSVWSWLARLNTRSGEFFAMAWTDEAAMNYICAQRGYTHWFLERL